MSQPDTLGPSCPASIFAEYFMLHGIFDILQELEIQLVIAFTKYYLQFLYN